jgi:hypothetical protein
MKLPVNKRKELEKKGRRESTHGPGGGALGRLRQFERERGLKETEPTNPSGDEAKGEESEGEQRRDDDH